MRHPFLLSLFLLAPLALLHCAQEPSAVAEIAELRSAAEQGNAEAQNNLGNLYAQGHGVAQDLVEAYAWCNLAAAQGADNAKEYRDIVAEQLDTDSLAEAQKLSRKYFKLYVEPFQ